MTGRDPGVVTVGDGTTVLNGGAYALVDGVIYWLGGLSSMPRPPQVLHVVDPWASPLRREVPTEVPRRRISPSATYRGARMQDLSFGDDGMVSFSVWPYPAGWPDEIELQRYGMPDGPVTASGPDGSRSRSSRTSTTTSPTSGALTCRQAGSTMPPRRPVLCGIRVRTRRTSAASSIIWRCLSTATEGVWRSRTRRGGSASSIGAAQRAITPRWDRFAALYSAGADANTLRVEFLGPLSAAERAVAFAKRDIPDDRRATMFAIGQSGRDRFLDKDHYRGWLWLVSLAIVFEVDEGTFDRVVDAAEFGWGIGCWAV